MTCQGCHQNQPHVGPFHDKGTGAQYAKLCKACKLRVTMSDPERVERLQGYARTIQAQPVVQRRSTMSV